MIFKIIIPSDKAKVIDYINRLPEAKQYNVEVKLKREKRTLPQNQLYWLWLSCISDETGNDKDTLHEFFKYKFLGVETHAIRISNMQYSVDIRCSTSKLDTKAMTAYLNHIQEFTSAELGILLPNPEDMYFEEFYSQYKNYI